MEKTTTIRVSKSTSERIDNDLSKHFQFKPSKQDFIDWLINKFLDGELVDIKPSLRYREKEETEQ